VHLPRKSARRRIAIKFALVVGVLHAPTALSSDLEDLARRGYAVVETTRVRGEYEGCEFDRRLVLDDGRIFVCREYKYSYSFSPEVLVLEHIRQGDKKFIINDDEMRGTLEFR
jgi:hypothetical protein